MSTLFKQFRKASTEEQCKTIQQQLQTGGFSLFREFVDEYLEFIKAYTDEGKEEIHVLLDKSKRFFPDPGSFSPAWQTLWEDYGMIVKYKNIAMETVPANEREGEWQVILDNPYINQQVVCYPGLDFLEACYLYGYFHPGLENNEYLRLQKIQTLLYNHGQTVVVG
jgi:hypothetical protein